MELTHARANISSQYYYRLLSSQPAGKLAIEDEMKNIAVPLQTDKLEFIKNPVVAEFLGLEPNADFQESRLESAIITNLQKLLLELGGSGNRDVAHYSVLNGSEQLFAAKYLTYLPTQEQLKREIEMQKQFFNEQHGTDEKGDE